MSRGFLVQDWTTLRSSVNAPLVQDPSSWLDLAGFSDVTCWLDVMELTPPAGSSRNFVELELQTAPSFDDAYFVPVAPATRFGTVTPFVQVGLTPTIVRSAKTSVSNNLMRFLRWSLKPSASGTWDITFRIRAIAACSATFVPPLIGNCVAWYRGDLGVTINAGTSDVNVWNDQSGTNDANKNLTAGVSPKLNVGDASYQGQTTLTFVRASGTYLTSTAWATTLVQADTWIIVGHTVSPSLYEVAMESNDMTTGQNFSRLATNEVQIGTTAAMSTSTAGTQPWSSPSVVLGEFNGGSSKIYINNFATSKTTTGTVNNTPPTTTGQGSLTIGSSDKAWALGNYWDGTIAEIIGFSGVLSSRAKAQLRQYFRGRYGINVG